MSSTVPSPAPSSKRQDSKITVKSEASDGPDPFTADCTFSAEFWHTDGDILVRVRTTWYLLHRGLLAAHSKLFRPDNIHRMATGQELIGRQLFVPPCDNTEDWESVLRSVYSPARLNLWGDSLSGDDLHSLIRVAKTLKFSKLVTLALDRLDTELPTSLDAFDAAYAIPKIGSIFEPSACIYDEEVLFKIINLALELDHTRVLPCAYLLALMEACVEDIAHGIVSHDGSRVLLHPKAQQALLNAHANIYPILLHRFSDILIHATAAVRHCTSRPPSVICHSAAIASEARLRSYIASQTDNPDLTKRRLLIASHRQGELFEDALQGRCGQCSEVAMAQMEEQRRSFWQELPALFGLVSWDDL